MKKPMKPDVAKANVGKHTLSAHGSIHLNRKMGGKLPHLTVCAEAWILDYRVRVFLLDLLMVFLFWELNHCRNQYLTYGLNHERLRNDEPKGRSAP